MEDSLLVCPVCGDKKCVPPAGNNDSKVAIIAEFPGQEEILKGRPMVGNMGNLLRIELGKLGVDLKRVRVGNLWHHAPNGNDKCLQYGAEQIIKDCIGREVILLMGSEAVKFYTGAYVSDVSSMVVKSNYFSGTVFASVNPALAFHQSVGEVRLALKKFTDYIHERGLL
jgi:uracil-DNA glycosylase family 4